MAGGSKNTTNTVSEPPKFIQPYLQDAAQRSFNLYQQGGQQFFPNSTAVPFSPQTQQALDLTQQRAISGGAATNAAQGYAQGQIQGDGVNSDPFANGSRGIASQLSSTPGIAGQFAGGSNPYLDQTFGRAADSVQQRLQSGFAGSGRNIDAARPVAAQELNDLATNIYGGDYQNQQARYLSALQGDQGAFQGDQSRKLAALQGDQSVAANAYGDERKRQDYLAGLAPSLDSTDYQDLSALQGVGSQYEGQYSQQLNDQINRFNFQQQQPGASLDQYIARIQGGYPGGSTNTQMTPPAGSGVAGAAGGALTAYQLSGGNPYAAAAGALGGYFLSR